MSWRTENFEIGNTADKYAESLNSHFSTWLAIQIDTASIHDRRDQSSDVAEISSTAQDDFDQLSLDDLLDVYQCLELLGRAWPDSDELPITIGPYQLVRQLGRGGMGEVWEAEQLEPIHRRLAIKLVRAKITSVSTRSRFDSERKLLARLEHPNIARVLDAGSFANGRLYLAMELVDGTTLTCYCDRQQLDVPERLRLMISVCSAVEYAHQNAIIHRDLKPSNILIQEIDGCAVPKVIDFGLAKLLNDPEDDQHDSVAEALNEQTLHGQLLGTVQYMSPEQTMAGQAMVDTRTDVYSLGVLLYQLLTDELPIRQDHASPSSTLETLDRIRTEIPQPPSEVIQAEPNIGTRSRQEATSFPRRQSLSKELDWIALKALQKDPDDRYATVSEFSNDLERYLNNQPLAAGPPTSKYLLKKCLQKNKKWLTVASLLILSLLLGISGTTWGWIQSSKARTEAESNWQQARQSNKILTDIFGDLDVSLAEAAEQPVKMVLAQRLIAAGKQLTNSTVGAPLDVAEMQLKLAHSLNALGFPEDALPICQTAFNTFDHLTGIHNIATRDAARELSRAFLGAGELAAADNALKPVLQYCQDELPEFHTETMQTLDQLAALKFREGDYAAALPLRTKTYEWRELRLGKNDFETVKAASKLGACHIALFQHELAIPILEQSLAFCRQELPPDHPETIQVLTNLSWAYGRMESAANQAVTIAMANEAYAMATKIFGKHHRQSYEAMMQIGLASFSRGEFDNAQTTLETATVGLSETCGPSHPKLVIGNAILAKVYQKNRKWALAIPLIRANLKVRKSKLPLQHPTVLHGYLELADAYNLVGDFEKSQQLLLEALKLQDQDSQARWLTELKIGNTFFELGRFDAAVEHIQIAKAGFENKSGRYDFDTGLAVADLGKALAGNDEFDSAVQLLQEYQRDVSNEVGPRSPLPAIITAQLGIVLSQAGRLDEGIELMESIVNSRGRLKKMSYLVRELRSAYQSAGLNDRLKNSIQLELQFYRRRLEPNSALLSRRLAELGSEAIRFAQWKTADSLLKESLEIYQSLSIDDTVPMHSDDSFDAWELGVVAFQASIAELAIELETSAENERQSGEDWKPLPAETRENVVHLLEELDDPFQALSDLMEHTVPKRKEQLDASVRSLVDVLAAASWYEESSRWDALRQNEFGIQSSD